MIVPVSKFGEFIGSVSVKYKYQERPRMQLIAGKQDLNSVLSSLNKLCACSSTPSSEAVQELSRKHHGVARHEMDYVRYVQNT